MSDEIESQLKTLNKNNPELISSMVVTEDGLTLAFDGKVTDSDMIAAHYSELLNVCGKILKTLDSGPIEEMFFRSKDACVAVWPLWNKGLFACLAKPEVNSMKLQMMTWKVVSEINSILQKDMDFIEAKKTN